VSDEMSEEKPNFKVTDRRLFNPDGTPREGIEREEPEDSANESAGAQEASARAAPTPRATPTPPAGDEESRGERHEESQTGAEVDPTPFANLVMFIASPAAASMGMTDQTGMAAGEIDLPFAKECIDALATLRERTHGNLSPQEQQIIEGVLAELRMQYVSLTSTQSPPKRGFTGSDITGGR
jgi:hypothetical protein